ncbi:MAG: DUF6868 family protein [Pseudomonadales bacterium]|jgi:hypothetical protein
MDLEQVTALFGWMSVIHIAFLSFASIVLILARRPVARLHSKLTGVAETELPTLYFNYLGNYKIFAICTAIAPYIALRLI